MRGNPRRGLIVAALAVLCVLAIPGTAKADVVDAGGQRQWIACAFAARYPDQVAGVMLVDAVYPGIHRTFLPSYRGDWHEGGTTIDMDASERAATRGPGLGDTPLLVIVAGDPQNGSAWADRRWNREQARAARLSTVSDLWVARSSGHLVQVDQPEILVEGLRWLLERAGKGAGQPPRGRIHIGRQAR